MTKLVQVVKIIMLLAHYANANKDSFKILLVCVSQVKINLFYLINNYIYKLIDNSTNSTTNNTQGHCEDNLRNLYSRDITIDFEFID